MKKLSYILLAAVAILGASCGKSNNAATPSASDAQQGEAYETSTNIRYVNFDSIQQYYVLAQEVKSKIESISLEYVNKGNQYQNQLAQKANNIQQKQDQRLYLSEQSMQNDINEYQRLQNYYAQELQKFESTASQQSAELQKMLSDSINNFIIDFNKEYKYDAILDKASGLYFNPALDITKEVIEGLNNRYKPAAAPADTTKTSAKK